MKTTWRRRREEILDDAIRSGAFGNVKRDRVYHPRNPAQASDAVLRRCNTDGVFLIRINPDNSLTRGRDRYVSDTGDAPASDGA